MDLAPGAALTRPVLADFPFALAVDFQPGRIHHQVDRLGPRPARDLNLQRLGPPRHQGVVGNRQGQPQEPDDGAGQAFHPPVGQVKHRFEPQQRLNRLIRVAERRPPLPGRRRPPVALQKFLVNPDGQTAPFYQGPILLRPVGHPILDFRGGGFRRWQGLRGHDGFSVRGSPNYLDHPEGICAPTPTENAISQLVGIRLRSLPSTGQEILRLATMIGMGLRRIRTPVVEKC